MENSNQFGASVESLLKGMESFLGTKTVVGEPIRMDDAIILPLVDISFGCATGTTAGGKSKRDGAAGGINGKVTPSAILIIQNGTCKLINVKSTDNVTRLLDMVPDLVNKLSSGKEKKVTISDEEARQAVENK